jgi:hypothetical protein
VQFAITQTGGYYIKFQIKVKKKMLLFPEAAMRNISITQERSDEVSEKDDRTGGHNSKITR